MLPARLYVLSQNSSAETSHNVYLCMPFLCDAPPITVRLERTQKSRVLDRKPNNQRWIENQNVAMPPLSIPESRLTIQPARSIRAAAACVCPQALSPLALRIHSRPCRFLRPPARRSDPAGAFPNNLIML
jgi:hypothetical protein